MRLCGCLVRVQAVDDEVGVVPVDQRVVEADLDPLGDHLERVDVEAGVGLVQDRDLGGEQLQLDRKSVV